MSENQAVIECQDISLIINGTSILKGINFKLTKGEHCVLLGLNGSGKTSLLKLMSGYGYPSEGKLKVLGKYFGEIDLRILRKRIGWVHMDLKYDIPPFMNSIEVVISGNRGSLVIYEDAEKSELDRAMHFLELMNAGKIINRRFGSLSTGERQKVLIARALSMDPEILLLDEPCLGLDPVSREEFLASVSGMLIKRRDLTVLYVTHHIEEIPEIFERMMIMDRGNILVQGTRDAVLKKEILSHIYGDEFTIKRSGKRYYLQFKY
ncbi:MAG: ATP-binding cassette domain-containing protein [Spirochaetes bacterium]|nr:ATP-binding cassette domain-containing protein [Spirochaetota bacterium]